MSEVSEVIVLGKKEFHVVKKGRAQAEQAVQFSKWLSEYGLPMFEELATPDGSIPSLDVRELLRAILGSLSADALIDLFVVVVGCSKKEANEHFDLELLVDAAEATWESQPGLRRLVERFFSTQDSTSSIPDSSTPSEEPTDGQTTKS